MSEIIHHYCSASTFLSIIRKKQLWLTSLRQSNDRAEGEWCLQKWLDRFNVLIPAELSQRRAAKTAVEVFLHDIVALGTCFSEAADLLSQWRGYADDGGGFSIAFDRDGLSKALSEGDNGDIKFTPVEYSIDTALGPAKPFHAMTTAFAPDYVGSNGRSLNINISPEARAEKKFAVEQLFRFKNPAFSEEREWRLYTLRSLSSESALKFRESGGVISPYMTFDFPSSAVLSVRLGPTNRTPVRVVQSLLESCGFNARVLTSSATYLSR